MGLPVVVLITGACYSLSGIHGGHSGVALGVAVLHGALAWLVFKIGGGQRLSPVPLAMLLATVSVGPLVVGHAMGYGDLRSLAYRMVQDDTSGRYPPDWKGLDRDALFPRWLERVNGRAGGSILGYLRAQAAIGWEGRERINKGLTRIERTGGAVWFAWALHLGFFLAAGAVAFFAALRSEPATARAATPAARPRRPGAVGGVVEAPGRGPADLPAAEAWTDVDEREDVRVSYHYEPRGAYPSLEEFLLARVRRSFRRGDGPAREIDVQNYLARVVEMREVSREELVSFVARHSGSTVRSRVPEIPERLRRAVFCRDEPGTKEVIWETDRGYWAMTWTKG